MGSLKMTKLNLLSLVLLAGMLKDISGNEGLNPIAPVRKVGEGLRFLCQSPANFSDKGPDILFRLEHDGKIVVDNEKALRGLTDIGAIIFEYTLSSVDYKHAGAWECSIPRQSFNDTQQLIVIQGNSNSTVLEEGVGGMLDCLADADKVFQTHLMVEWQVDGTKIGNSDERFVKRGVSQLEVKQINVNMEINCIVTAKDSNAGLDSSTKIMLPFSVVKTECTHGSNFTARAYMCGVKAQMTIEWFMKKEKLNSTMRADVKDNSSCITSWVNSTSCDIEIRISQGDTVVWSKNISEETTPKVTQSNNVDGKVIGVVVGVLAAVGLCIFIVILYRLYKRHRRNQESTLTSQPGDVTTDLLLTSMPTSNIADAKDLKDQDVGANGDQ